MWRRVIMAVHKGEKCLYIICSPSFFPLSFPSFLLWGNASYDIRQWGNYPINCRAKLSFRGKSPIQSPPCVWARDSAIFTILWQSKEEGDRNSQRDSPALRWYAASGPSPRGARKKYIKLTQIALPYGGSYGVHSDYISCQRFSSRAPKWEVKSGGKLVIYFSMGKSDTLCQMEQWSIFSFSVY